MIFGSFISGIITFWVLYINRKDMIDGDVERQRISEMDKMEKDLKETFLLLRIDGNIMTAESYFLFIVNKVPEKYHQTEFYKRLFDTYIACKENKINSALAFEALVYRDFLKYREMYIEGK